jgi:hypothetical protein
LAVVVLLGVGMGGTAAAFPSGGALPPVLTLVIPVAGLNGVPIDAVGVAMNVTVTAPAAPGFLTVYPCGDTPVASNLNYVQDQAVPNFVISGLSPDGDVCIDTSAVVDVVVDLAGYIPSGSPIVTLPEPARIVSRRPSRSAADSSRPSHAEALRLWCRTSTSLPAATSPTWPSSSSAPQGSCV